MLPIVLAYATTIWGVVMAFSPALQIARVFKRRDSRDVSLGYLCVLEIGFVLWLSYGITVAQWPLIIANAVAAVTGALTIAAVLRFRHGPDGGGDPEAGLA